MCIFQGPMEWAFGKWPHLHLRMLHNFFQRPCNPLTWQVRFKRFFCIKKGESGLQGKFYLSTLPYIFVVSYHSEGLFFHVQHPSFPLRWHYSLFNYVWISEQLRGKLLNIKRGRGNLEYLMIYGIFVWRQFFWKALKIFFPTENPYFSVKSYCFSFFKHPHF